MGYLFFYLLILIGLRRGVFRSSRGNRGGIMGDKSTWLTFYGGNVENENGSWKLGEANKNRDKVRGNEGNTGASGSQDTENEKEELWEDCSLAKFSQFLGFSTEGLEKERLNFLIKIRKSGKRFTTKNSWRSPSLKGN
ncbi:hypothetical protein CK203_082079 [Vitis vinifera]|uniref:Uncharacterized protein n=1 Tax=Vitis vinifera TaxID=29760 RepID=A0A438E1X5_VITVI|nr:hypothetical protein CK203_082079 [Vitis vinifera]